VATAGGRSPGFRVFRRAFPESDALQWLWTAQLQRWLRIRVRWMLPVTVAGPRRPFTGLPSNPPRPTLSRAAPNGRPSRGPPTLNGAQSRRLIPNPGAQAGGGSSLRIWTKRDAGRPRPASAPRQPLPKAGSNAGSADSRRRRIARPLASYQRGLPTPSLSPRTESRRSRSRRTGTRAA
jgi:hypothetical protein